MITIIRGEDWVGLYKDGNLLREDHSLAVSDVLEALGVEHETRFADDGWLSERGWLPNKLSNVVFQ